MIHVLHFLQTRERGTRGKGRDVGRRGRRDDLKGGEKGTGGRQRGTYFRWTAGTSYAQGLGMGKRFWRGVVWRRDLYVQVLP